MTLRLKDHVIGEYDYLKMCAHLSHDRAVREIAEGYDLTEEEVREILRNRKV